MTSQVLLQQRAFLFGLDEDFSAAGQVSGEEQEISVAARPQGEGLAAELLPGLLVRLGRLLVVPVRLQICSPEEEGK